MANHIEPRGQDKLAERFLKIMHRVVPDRFEIQIEDGNRWYELKAFMATGGEMLVDGKYYYSEIPNTVAVVLSWGISMNRREGETIDIMAGRGGGYVLNSPVKYRAGLLKHDYRNLSKLLSMLLLYAK
ncbi:hypothetical protein D3C81_334830 [compost metagenome]